MQLQILSLNLRPCILINKLPKKLTTLTLLCNYYNYPCEIQIFNNFFFLIKIRNRALKSLISNHYSKKKKIIISTNIVNLIKIVSNN